MHLLKQSTAVGIPLGPFVDSTDGFTAETGLTITPAEVRLKKDGNAWGACSEANNAVHEEEGWYEKAFDTTDTGSLGRLMVAVYVAGALPVWREFMVVPANVYDALVGGTDTLQVDVAQWLGTAPATPTVAGVPEVDVTHAAGSAQASIATQASVNTIDDLLDTEIAAIKADTAAILIDTAEIGAAGAGLTVLATQASVNTIDDFLDTEVAAIKAKTDNLPVDPADESSIQAALAAISAFIDTEVALILAAVDTEVAAIKAKTDNLPAAPAATGDIPTAVQIATELFDQANGIETGITLRQTQRVLLSAASGKLSGADTTSVAIRNLADTITRISATVDEFGNRSAVTLNLG